MKIALRGFMGEQPRIEAHRLPDMNASVARNVKLFRGNVEPFLQATQTAVLGKVGEKKSIYRANQALDDDTRDWFHWLNDCDVARGPVTGNDTLERTYYCEAGQPMRATDLQMGLGGPALPVNSLFAGIPAPLNTPSVSVSSINAITFDTTAAINGTTDTITATAHGFYNGMGAIYSKQGGTVNVGLTDANTYFVRAVDANTLALYETGDDAESDVNRVALTATGAETHRLTPAETATQVLVGYTYVTTWDQEGPMSPVSAPIDYRPNRTLTVSQMSVGPGLAGYSIDRKRVYVAQTDATGRTVLRFWKEIALALELTTGTIDFVSGLGAAAQSPEPVAPPTDLIGLRMHPNGFMFGVSPLTKKFCRSEVFKPYAWPTEYQDFLAETPVGCEVIGQSAVILTNSRVYIASGNDPLRMIPYEVEGARQGCVAKRSIALTNVGVLYASPDGLVAVQPNGAIELVTRALFTREQWQAFKPESMHAAVHDMRYFCWWQVDVNNRGLMIFDFTGDGFGVIHCSDWYSVAYADPRRDALFVADPVTGNVFKWEGSATPMTARWRSKRFTIDRALNMGAGRLTLTGTVTFRLFSDSLATPGTMQLRHERTVTNGKAFQLPRGYRAYRYEVEIEGTGTVKEAIVASTIGEVAVQ